MLKRNVERSVTLLSSSSSSSSFRKNEHTHAFVARLFFLTISFFFVQGGSFSRSSFDGLKVPTFFALKSSVVVSNKVEKERQKIQKKTNDDKNNESHFYSP